MIGLVGRRLGRYAIVNLLGAGGTGEVCHAWVMQFGQRWAARRVRRIAEWR
jgi:hypothetical protein